MSDQRARGRGTPRGAEGSWRARGRGKGRGSTSPSSSWHTNGPIQRDASVSANPTASASVSFRRRMDLMASVSRSSGLEKDGDDLKNYKTQEEYKHFIKEKVESIFKDHARSVSESEDDKKRRIDSQENVLILFRKLREGVSSSNRNDAFALETYETSLYLSALFDSPKQTISIIPHLLPVRHEDPPKFTSHSPSGYSVMISLLHHLVAQYPSQGTYFQQRNSLPSGLLHTYSEGMEWLASLTKSLRFRNYAKFAMLTQRSHVMALLQRFSDNDKAAYNSQTGLKSDSDLAIKAILNLLDSLRKKVSETAWTIIRATYRELSCDSTPNETGAWLSRSLCLENLLDSRFSVDAERWLVDKIPIGHVRRKEGVEGKWVVCKVR
ncbi:hypothetical protein JR316_0006956 [Psilocybe cubensis]|uniref:Uncharacterized protein n=2 Tax=Psilocybe cubensis TaxID=181762 RepID=A0ACB8GXW0_PSICU|nr:hypothetical protein JR316_0006956 [Psilocybe cubensis]KAH9480358.1 hypothetical protein JR316_0006956 [Psilocybe cubensis]